MLVKINENIQMVILVGAYKLKLINIMKNTPGERQAARGRVAPAERQ